MLSLSFKETWKNPALIGVSVLQIIALFFLGLLFGLFMYGVFSTRAPSIGMIIAFLFVLLLQFLIFLLIRGFFSAGFYVMVKNVTQDGSTTFREFVPGAKRYWLHFAAYLFCRYLIVLLLMMPFLVSLSSDPMGGIGFFPSAAQIGWFFFWVVSSAIVLFFWLLWGEALIVYEDLSAWEAIKGSIRMANENVGQTVKVALLSGLVVFVGILVLAMLIIPYQALFVYPQYPQGITPETQLPGSFIAVQTAIDIVTYAVMMIAVIIVMLFIFHNFMRVAGKHKRKRRKK